MYDSYHGINSILLSCAIEYTLKANRCCDATAIVCLWLLDQELAGLKTKHSEVEYVHAVYP